MSDDSFRDCQSRCYAFGIRLVKPRGVRKYYCLDKDPHRFRLGTTWEEAKLCIGAGIQWLFENYEPPKWPETKEPADGSPNQASTNGNLEQGDQS